MTYLDRLWKQPKTEGELVIGTILTPSVLISDFPRKTFPTAEEHLEVIDTLTVDGIDVLVTRMGGLFARPPADLAGMPEDGDDPAETSRKFQAKAKFEADVAGRFNLIQCELALRHHFYSLPSVPFAIDAGWMIDRHIAIQGSGGAAERTLSPFVLLLQTGRHGDGFRTMPPATLGEVRPLEWSSRLATASPTLPRLLIAAYSSLHRHEQPEAVLMGWIVIEQLVDELWRSHVRSLEPGVRRERLLDGSTYTAAVRIEGLQTAGLLEPDLCLELHAARKLRNELAHRAQVADADAVVVLQATHSMLERWLGVSLPFFLGTGVSVGW